MRQRVLKEISKFAAARGTQINKRNLASAVNIPLITPKSALTQIAKAPLARVRSSESLLRHTSRGVSALRLSEDIDLDCVVGRRFFFGSAFFPETSKKYDERKLIGYSPEQMFKVVADVEKYHEFVPWCVRSVIKNKRDCNYIEAELEVGFQVFVERYISKITLNPPHVLQTQTAESTLFKHLESCWKFDKGPTPNTCWLFFHVNFSFKSPLYKHVASMFFEEVVKRMMGAFIGRCQYYYGPSSLSNTSSSRSSDKSLKMA